MTEAPDVYPDFPDDDDDETVADDGVEGFAGALGGAGSVDEVRTGDPRVDDVLALLATLDERPVGEHAPVFEQAHGRLRAALDPDRESA